MAIAAAGPAREAGVAEIMTAAHKNAMLAPPRCCEAGASDDRRRSNASAWRPPRCGSPPVALRPADRSAGHGGSGRSDVSCLAAS